mmetsp:Transcript_54203/g.117134  ORF Transcript_54203/g.117134 Transcript_54203/m.117134 type:complete len:325 (-) Transcript_54203:138-1112(-)
MVFPAIPDDARLRSESAECDETGSLRDTAYQPLIKHFKGEPPQQQHPDPYNPGVAPDEVVPVGVRLWQDENTCSTRGGAGWIATGFPAEGQTKGPERWFNVRTWGSFRLAFLLARLQRKVWERRSVPFATLDFDSLGCRKDVTLVDGVAMSRQQAVAAATALASAIRQERHSLLPGLPSQPQPGPQIGEVARAPSLQADPPRRKHQWPRAADNVEALLASGPGVAAAPPVWDRASTHVASQPHADPGPWQALQVRQPADVEASAAPAKDLEAPAQDTRAVPEPSLWLGTPRRRLGSKQKLDDASQGPLGEPGGKRARTEAESNS